MRCAFSPTTACSYTVLDSWCYELGIPLCLVHSFLLYGVSDDYWVHPPWLYSANLGTILYAVSTAYSGLEIGDLSLWKFVSEEYICDLILENQS